MFVVVVGCWLLLFVVVVVVVVVKALLCCVSCLLSDLTNELHFFLYFFILNRFLLFATYYYAGFSFGCLKQRNIESMMSGPQRMTATEDELCGPPVEMWSFNVGEITNEELVQVKFLIFYIYIFFFFF